ncbi:UAP56-interacting factor isoform X2 [Microcaecilia unicolor]|uniref:UAP56-interacting factor-like isoform X2 n=1 Tax=Microcaecilia unicolor TaxID=1415580 RepID=A0A6P7YMG4_9AMPH|nr:UAP56-interacting factor-like isoform X2 [Microcaecilia unicolor]
MESEDDIIKLRWNKQTDQHPTLNKMKQQFRPRNVNQKTTFLGGNLQNQPGYQRIGRRFTGKQQRYFETEQNIDKTSPENTTSDELNDTSHSNQMETEKDTVDVNSSSTVLPEGQKTFRPKGTTQRRGPIAPLTRRSTFQQRRRQNKYNLNRGVRLQQTAINAAVRRLKIRRWRAEPELSTSGAILTVNVSNPWANQMKRAQPPQYKQRFLRRRNTAVPFAKLQPKGVFLRFNFRGMGNQTNITMNERFSILKTRRNFKAIRPRQRTVLFS